MIVSEIFGPTFQGEGSRLGKRCGFVRLMACNLSCSWCDTPYTWDAKRYDLRLEGRSMTAAEIMAQIVDMNVNEIVVSGGEPLLHQRRKDWFEFIQLLNAHHHVTVETNGTINPTQDTRNHVDLFSVSPKLSHSGDDWPKRIVPPVLMQFSALAWDQLAQFKFVCQTVSDLDEVDEMVHAYEIPASEVWVMPEGVEPATINKHLSVLADEVIQRGYNVTTRLHVQTWGNRRGV